MRTGRAFASMWMAGVMAGILCAGAFAAVDSSTPPKSHKKAAKKPSLPPLPSGPQGPVPQISLDSMQAVAPHVTYQGGQLTIVAPNSTLVDILRAVRKLTGADVDIPTGATERVVTNIGPGPAPSVMADLLNGSHFNYVLLGSPADANTLTRVVLVAKAGPEAPAPAAGVVAAGTPSPTPQPGATQNAAEAPEAEATDDSTDENAEQNPPEPEPPPQPLQGDAAVKTPQQLLQEMQQRQLQLQQGQPGAQPPGGPGGVPPGQKPPDQQ